LQPKPCQDLLALVLWARDRHEKPWSWFLYENQDQACNKSPVFWRYPKQAPRKCLRFCGISSRNFLFGINLYVDGFSVGFPNNFLCRNVYS